MHNPIIAIFAAGVAGCIFGAIWYGVLSKPYQRALGLNPDDCKDKKMPMAPMLVSFLVAIVTIFVDFTLTLIIWVVFAIAYQQIENYVIQPQIQKRATKIEAFVVLVAVLFGSTLFGILGAILAIPAAASLQIAVQEWRAYRREIAAEEEDVGGPRPAPEAT